ncbi:MAG: mechanosensitive ion channel family protein [Candidatus Limnocylindrales bacterium]
MGLPQFNDIGGDLGAVAIAAIAATIGLALHWLVWRLLERGAARTAGRLDESFLLHTKNAARFAFAILAVYLALALMASEGREFTRGILIFVGIITAGWFVVGLLRVGYDAALSRYSDDGPDDLEERQMRTQLEVLVRFGTIIVWLVAVALALLTIPGVAPLAASLLAGAGVLGIVLGVAAGPIIGNFIAGIQIAFTQPIKVGDVVVIEGEWGHIGEITATYVVVYIWDKRRLIVPLSQIVNQPVENWTRRTNELLGTVKLFLDYRAPVDEIRAEYKRILDDSGLWDGEAWSVLVTGADDRTITVRALYSAPDAGVEWSLRCLVREKLIGFLQEEHPYALPVAREIQYQPE